MKKIILSVVVFVMCLIAVLTLSNKKVSATTDWLVDGVAYEGVVVKANSLDDVYVVYIEDLDLLWSYQYNDFYVSDVEYEPEKGAFVRARTDMQKWEVYQTYQSNSIINYNVGYEVGYGEGLNANAYSIGYSDGHIDGWGECMEFYGINNNG